MKEVREDLVIDLAFLAHIPQESLAETGVLKQVVQQGELDEHEEDYPVQESRVKIQYESRLLCGRLLDSFKYYSYPVNFVISDIQLAGVRLGLKSMKRGEEAYLTVPSQLHYGPDYQMVLSDGSQMRMDAPLLYRVKLLDFSTPRPNYYLSTTPLALFWKYLARLKAQGNALYL